MRRAGRIVPTPPRISGSLLSDRGKICMRRGELSWVSRASTSRRHTHEGASAGEKRKAGAALIGGGGVRVQAPVSRDHCESFAPPSSAGLCDQPFGLVVVGRAIS